MKRDTSRQKKRYTSPVSEGASRSPLRQPWFLERPLVNKGILVPKSFKVGQNNTVRSLLISFCRVRSRGWKLGVDLFVYALYISPRVFSQFSTLSSTYQGPR